jgi:hypothetical protein
MEESTLNMNKYDWVGGTKEDIEELILYGDAFFFQYRGRDYYIEGDIKGYLIQDPRIGEDGVPQAGVPYTDHPGHREAKTPEELMALPFLDGKTIFERFEELRFFNI